MAPLKRLAAFLIALLWFAPPALAEKRVALVIGNSAYKHAPALANPKNDAEGMAAALARLKFEVVAGTDLDKPAMERLLRAFAQKLATADVALVFYAGHGLQVHGRNYLVPIDGKLEQETDLAFEAVPLDLVQGLMEQGQRTNIMILDACRDNPLARNLARTMGTRSTSIGRGLGEAKAGVGTLIVYATQPGNVALDGDDGKNSPFTASLLKHIEAPGLEIRQVLTRVRNEVITATRDKQVPWDSSSLRGDFFFAAAPAKPDTPPASTPTPPTDNEGLFWSSIKDSGNIAHFKAYLARWPEGVFAALARIKVDELEKAALRADEDRKRRDDESKKEIPAKIASARQSIKDARAALAAKRYADAKRHAAAASTASDQATKGDAGSSDAQALARDVATLSKDVADALAAYVRPRLARARQLVNAARFDEAKRILDEAAQLVEGSPEIAAARREYEAARARPPAAPGSARSSTIEVGIILAGAAIGDARTVFTAEICASSCVQHPGCVGWAYFKSQAQCTLNRTITGRVRNEGWTSGAILATARKPDGAAPSAPTHPATPISGRPDELCRPGTARFVGGHQFGDQGQFACRGFFSPENLRTEGAILRWQIRYHEGKTECSCNLKTAR